MGSLETEQSKLVIIVESYSGIRDLLGDLIEYAGYVVQAYDSHDRAVKHLSEVSQPPRLAIVDGNLADLQAARLLSRKFPDLPIAYLSTNGRGYLKEQSLREQGITVIIPKPFDVHELLKFVHNPESLRREPTAPLPRISRHY